MSRGHPHRTKNIARRVEHICNHLQQEREREIFTMDDYLSNARTFFEDWLADYKELLQEFNYKTEGDNNVASEREKYVTKMALIYLQANLDDANLEAFEYAPEDSYGLVSVDGEPGSQVTSAEIAELLEQVKHDRLQVTLGDNNPESTAAIPVVVTVDQNFIQVEAEGFNSCGMADDQPLGTGSKSIAVFEIWEGKLRCLVWGDINQEDPTHTIDLGGARESQRDCYYCNGACHRDPEHACDGYLGDIDKIYPTKKEK